MIMLEKSDSQVKHYERKCEDMAARLRDTERMLQAMQSDMKKYQVRTLVEDGQGWERMYEP